MPKRVTSGRAYLRDLASGQHSSMALATLCLIQLARESNSRPPASINHALDTLARGR